MELNIIDTFVDAWGVEKISWLVPAPLYCIWYFYEAKFLNEGKASNMMKKWYTGQEMYHLYRTSVQKTYWNKIQMV